jgi:hypothetical protein
MSMTLRLEEMIKALDEHIEVLKQDLLFLMAECKLNSQITRKIIAIKRELDKAVLKRMKLIQILLSSR